MIVANLLLIISLTVYVFHFLFFWMYPSTDSIFYWQFANFIRTGSYFAPHPYYYTLPSTMEPPLYSVFLFLADYWPRADIIIHLAQILAVLGSGYLIFKIFSYYFSKQAALTAGCLSVLVPGHLIYVSNLVAEPMAVFYITLYLFILHQIINKRHNQLFFILLPYSALISLHRYNLLVFFIVAALLYLNYKKRTAAGYIGLFCGVLIFAGWILINHQLNGSWGISNAEGKHLYNRILHFDRILPPFSHPAFIKFRQLARLSGGQAGERDDYFKPWWFYEEALIKSTGNETKASLVMQEFALASLFSNPIKYIVDTPGFFLFAHADNPTFHDPLYLYGGSMKNNCDGMGNIKFCRALIKTTFANYVWDGMVKLIDFFYLKISRFINYFLLFPALIFCLRQKDKLFRNMAVLYILSILFFVMFEAPLPRYTYIFTPMRVMIILFTLGKFYGKKTILQK